MSLAADLREAFRRWDAMVIRELASFGGALSRPSRNGQQGDAKRTGGGFSDVGGRGPVPIERDIHFRPVNCVGCGERIRDHVNTMTRDEWHCLRCREGFGEVSA